MTDDRSQDVAVSAWSVAPDHTTPTPETGETIEAPEIGEIGEIGETTETPEVPAAIDSLDTDIDTEQVLELAPPDVDEAAASAGLEPPAPADPATPAAPAAPVEPATPAAPAAPVVVRRTVSAEVARQLHAAGARYCFTVPGESILPLLDDLAAAGLRVITTRHESGAAFMAEALAQSTGRPQVVAVSRAVGAANAAIGIHAAAADSAPVVFLVGQVERRYLGREAFQEVDLVHTIGGLAAHAAQLDDPGQTAALLGRAMRRLGSGRPGPLLLSLPRDVQEASIDVDPASLPSGARGPAVDHAEVRAVLKLLASSERGVIVAGGGVLRSRSTKRLVALSEALAIPVVASWRRPDVFPNDHANYLGMAGPWAPDTVRQRLVDADALLFIGARASEMTTFRYAVPARGTRWAQVDLQPRVAGAGLHAPTISIEADASRFLDAAWSDLRSAALDNEMRARREVRIAADREAWRSASDVAQGDWQGPGVHPGRLVATLRRVLPDNAVIATDAGNMGGWLARGYRFRRAGTFLGTTAGAMGFGLPAAIAASLQDPDRIAVAICGDGGFAMSMAELETAVREGSHPVALVLDDARYGTIAQAQRGEGRAAHSSELGQVDVAAVARAQGAAGFHVDDDAGFEPALREALAMRRPAVIHLTMDRSWVSVDELPDHLGD